MRPDLVGDVQAALAAVGVGLQWMRSYRRIGDDVTLTLGVFLAVGVWALAVDWYSIQDVPAFLLRSLPTVGSCIASVGGGVFFAAKAANAIGEQHPHPMVPATNSKD